MDLSTQLLSPLFNKRSEDRQSLLHPTDIRGAVCSLRHYIHIPQSNFARRLLLTSTQLTRLESFGSPAPESLLRHLQQLSEESHLPIYAQFFQSQATLSLKSKRIHTRHP